MNRQRLPSRPGLTQAQRFPSMVRQTSQFATNTNTNVHGQRPPVGQQQYIVIPAAPPISFMHLPTAFPIVLQSFKNELPSQIGLPRLCAPFEADADLEEEWQHQQALQHAASSSSVSFSAEGDSSPVLCGFSSPTSPVLADASNQPFGHGGPRLVLQNHRPGLPANSGHALPFILNSTAVNFRPTRQDTFAPLVVAPLAHAQPLVYLPPSGISGVQPIYYAGAPLQKLGLTNRAPDHVECNNLVVGDNHFVCDPQQSAMQVQYHPGSLTSFSTRQSVPAKVKNILPICDPKTGLEVNLEQGESQRDLESSLEISTADAASATNCAGSPDSGGSLTPIAPSVGHLHNASLDDKDAIRMEFRNKVSSAAFSSDAPLNDSSTSTITEATFLQSPDLSSGVSVDAADLESRDSGLSGDLGASRRDSLFENQEELNIDSTTSLSSAISSQTDIAGKIDCSSEPLEMQSSFDGAKLVEDRIKSPRAAVSADDASSRTLIKDIISQCTCEFTFGDFAAEMESAESAVISYDGSSVSSSSVTKNVALESVSRPSSSDNIAAPVDISTCPSESCEEPAAEEASEPSLELLTKLEEIRQRDGIFDPTTGVGRKFYPRDFTAVLAELPVCQRKPDYMRDAAYAASLADIIVSPEERKTLPPRFFSGINGASAKATAAFASRFAGAQNSIFNPSFCNANATPSTSASNSNADVRVFKQPPPPAPAKFQPADHRARSVTPSHEPHSHYQGRSSERTPPGPTAVEKKKAPIVIRSSLHEEVKLKSAGANAWVPRIKRGVDAEDATQSDEQKVQELLRKARSIFNRITPETFDELLMDFLALNIVGEESWTVVIDECFAKVVKDYKTYGQLYTKLFVQVHAQPDDPAITDSRMQTKAVFLRKLLTKCQNEFERVRPEMLSLLAQKREAINARVEEKPSEKAVLEAEFLETQEKERIRYAGTIMFLGELYLVKLLIAKIIQHCFTLLCSSEEESLQLACQLLLRIGSKFEADNEEFVIALLKKFEAILAKSAVTSITKFHIREVIDSRKNGWRSTRSHAAIELKPQTLGELDHAWAEEKAWKQLKLQEYNDAQSAAGNASRRWSLQQSFAKDGERAKEPADRRMVAESKAPVGGDALLERKELSKHLNAVNSSVSLRPETSFYRASLIKNATARADQPSSFKASMQEDVSKTGKPAD